jgi:membrane protein
MENPVVWGLRQLKRINETIWHTPMSEISRGRIFLIKQLRIIVLAVRGFTNDKAQLRASALTFYSLLSVIPILGIAFGIAKGLGLEADLEELISKELDSHKEVLEWLLTNSRNAIAATSVGLITGAGIIVLFYTAMSLLHHIENSFNHIWQIKSSRPWYRKFTDYLTIMIIAPVFILLSGSMTGFISIGLDNFIDKAPILAFFKPIVAALIRFAPYFLSWMVMTVMFIIMPNTKVKFTPALVSGIITGTVIQILQLLYWDVQVGIAKLNAIYVSFAAFPLMALWLQSTWTMVLLGAELSFAYQNVSRYEYESESLNISNYQKRALVLLIMQILIRNFSAGAIPISAEYIATSLKVPVRVVREILEELSTVRLVSEIHVNEEKEGLYQPAMDINKLTISFVFSKLDRRGIDHFMGRKNKDYDSIIAILDKFDKLTTKSDSNMLIKDL